MFKRAEIKLTILYSGLFLFLFWTFSFGLYVWMNNSFGESYISQVEQRQKDTDAFSNQNAKVVTIAGDIAIDQLRNILLALNGGLLLIIPVASWFLAKRTLTPVQKMHEQQKQFVSDASHEMRTPLAIMSGEIEVILKKKRTVADYKKTLVSTKEETDRLSKLVENLLFLAKDNQNTQILQHESIDITDSINEVTQALLPKSKQKKVSIGLEVKAVATAPIVKGYPSLLRQLFYNLLDNAITYTPKRGKITITLLEVKSTIVIAIHDTGIGIAKEEQSKILNRFYRVDTSRSETKGYGLGLSIVKSIIARHNGKLLITSEVKKGSTFTVILPKG